MEFSPIVSKYHRRLLLLHDAPVVYCKQRNSLVACGTTSPLIKFPRLQQAVHAIYLPHPSLKHCDPKCLPRFVHSFANLKGSFCHRWISRSLKVSCHFNIFTSKTDDVCNYDSWRASTHQGLGPATFGILLHVVRFTVNSSILEGTALLKSSR